MEFVRQWKYAILGALTGLILLIAFIIVGRLLIKKVQSQPPAQSQSIER
ncbi:MAG: hypothetical protein ABI430_01500 [Candidatus Taylorbacteria bacterium]